MEPTRLSRKAQAVVDELTAKLSASVRRVASHLATAQEREFADEKDAKEAYRLMVLKIAERFQAAGDKGFEDPTAY
jgi:hypothetical protein